MTRPGDLSSLPSLREARPATPETPAPLRPAIKVPDRLPDSKSQETPAETATASADAGSSTSTTNQVPDQLTPTEVTSPSPDARPALTAAAFDAAMNEAKSNLAEERWYQALFVLSKFYDRPELTSQQRQELVDLLDPLAAKVVYSQEHLVSDAHEVRRGETLAQIATANQIPPELLANINGIEKPDLLIPGFENLKSCVARSARMSICKRKS